MALDELTSVESESIGSKHEETRDSAAITVAYESSEAVTGGRMNWRQWIVRVYVILYLVIGSVALPLIIWDAVKHEMYFKAVAWPTAGLCALIAIGVTGYLMLNHIVHFTRPNQQRYILRILLLVPIYSINASFVIRWPQSAIYLDTVSSCYKSFVIYCFLFYLIQYLTEHYDVEDHLSKKDQIKSPVPFCCIKPGPNKRLLRRCRNGVMNFVVLGPLLAFGLILAYSLDRNYTQGEFSPSGTWFWLTIVNALSQLWASYCLTVFYNATSEETAPLHAFPQMLCVKFSIFVSFLQQVIISLLVDQNVIVGSPERWQEYDKTSLSGVIHNFCLCIELAILSLVHLYAFSYKAYMEGTPLGFTISCKLFCDYTDIAKDMKKHSEQMANDMKTQSEKMANDVKKHSEKMANDVKKHSEKMANGMKTQSEKMAKDMKKHSEKMAKDMKKHSEKIVHDITTLGKINEGSGASEEASEEDNGSLHDLDKTSSSPYGEDEKTNSNFP